MRVCDRCKDPAKKSSKTMKDQHGGEVELCRECDAEFIAWLDNKHVPQDQNRQGKTARK